MIRFLTTNRTHCSRSYAPRLGTIALTGALLAGGAACGSDDDNDSVTTASRDFGDFAGTGRGVGFGFDETATTEATPSTGGEAASTL